MHGTALKELMRQEGVSQRRVAHRLGLRPETLSRRLAREVSPDLTARILAAVLAELRAADAADRRHRAALCRQLEALLDQGDTRPLVRTARRRTR